MAFGVPPVPAFLMGIVTGCVGGIIRDMVAGRPSIIIRPEIYVTAAAVSASLTVAGTMISLGNALVWILAWLAGFLLRSAAIRWQLALPRSEEHTSELQSLMRISYAVFCLKKKKN